MRENNYQVEFFCRCPVNNIRIHYTLTIRTDQTIMVEKLVDRVSTLNEKLHEDLADELAAEFGGHQKLEAYHHGVYLWTVRGE
jgi:hypothetical protein